MLLTVPPPFTPVLLLPSLTVVARCPCSGSARGRWPEAWARCDRCGDRVPLALVVGRG